MTVRWRGGACATHWSTSTQAQIKELGVESYFDMRCFTYNGMKAWLRERSGLCSGLLDTTQKMIAKPKPAEGEKLLMVVETFLP